MDGSLDTYIIQSREAFGKVTIENLNEGSSSHIKSNFAYTCVTYAIAGNMDEGSTQLIARSIRKT